jgi:CPA2 family monovalent cation:H+ antiporter-2
MAEGVLLRDLVVLFAAALPIVVVFQRLHVPTVVGFLVAGVVIGPHGAGLIADTAEVDSLAALGVVPLLFVVGLELSFRQLADQRRIVLVAGVLQVLLTGGLAAAAALAAGFPVPEAVVLGFVVVHSSTVVVLQVLAQRGDLDAPHGRIAVGILLIQDLSLVPMILLTRLLATPAAASWLAVTLVLAKAAAAIGIIVALALLIMPAVLRYVVQLRSRELFTGAIVLFCLGTAWLASQFGLSLALGALIAGLVISESEYSHQAVADILPFRDAFNSIFFISIGMLLRVDFLREHFIGVVTLALGVIVFKALVLPLAILPVYRSLRVALLAALSLAAVGELSFVLARFAQPLGLLPPAHAEWFIAVAVLTMLASPFVIQAAPALTARVLALLGITRAAQAPERQGARNHVLIVGYGLNGENLAHVLRQTGLPYLILELNPERTAAARSRGEPVLYGDATRPAVLAEAGAGNAQVIVVAISDRLATRRIVALARQHSAQVPIIVRTRYVAEMDDLRRLGATEVIPEEFETSVEIFARVLRRLRVPRNVIALQIDLIRQQGYSMLRGVALPRQTLDQLGDILAATTTESFMVPRTAPTVGLSIRELQLRKQTGVTIIAVVRGGQPLTNPPPDLQIQSGDILVMVGDHAQLDRALLRLGETPAAEAPPA